MFLGEAPRNVREKRRGGEDNSARGIVRLGVRARFYRGFSCDRSSARASRVPLVAHFHCSIKTGAKGAAADHAAYIAREGRFADEESMARWKRRGSATCRPGRARIRRPSGAPRTLRARERQYVSGVRARLPRELERDHQIALVQRFIESELGKPTRISGRCMRIARNDGGAQPHVHVMFSDRIQDGIERGPEQYFKRANRKSPEKGGALKRSYGANKTEAAQTYRDIRARWGEVQNLALEAHGIQARVDHRSLAEQGIHEREPGVHQGPAVAGIEARGEVSEVGGRQREQIAAREEKREAVLEEARGLERAQEVAERVAARERRELAPLAAEAPAEDRAELERAVEADRRAQLERTAEAAARRVERREAALETATPRQLPLFTRLVSQGRALQQRLAKAFERVKDWVQERFRPVLTQEEIQAGKAKFRAEYERHRAEEAERARALEAGRERYDREKAAELARQQELERAAKERSAEERDRGKDLGRGAEEDHSLTRIGIMAWSSRWTPSERSTGYSRPSSSNKKVWRSPPRRSRRRARPCAPSSMRSIWPRRTGRVSPPPRRSPISSRARRRRRSST